tara:strand:- start:1902 stop:2114 length:213 start_codon:yes stop_codon:yes gene_type:complete
MKPSEILKQMNELREQWRKQGFKYTKEQQVEYDKLLQLRRERVQYFIKNGIVSKGGLRKKEEKEQTPSES